MVDGAYRKAYNLLSADLQASEPYDDFIQNPNYTLKKGCWITGTMHVSQRNSLTWDGGVELTQVSCVDTTPIAYYDWHFEVQNQNGLFVITSLGLYPTGSQINNHVSKVPGSSFRLPGTLPFLHHWDVLNMHC